MNVAKKIKDLKGISNELLQIITKCVELNPYFRMSAKELLKEPLIKENGQKELAGINEKSHRPDKIYLDIDQIGYHGLGDNGLIDDTRAELTI